nr:hypothetical protein [Pedobacter kyonggii]
MLVPPHAHTPAGLTHRPVSAMSGLDHSVSCTALSELNLVAAGTIPIFSIGRSKADNGTFGTEMHRTFLFKI